VGHVPFAVQRRLTTRILTVSLLSVNNDPTYQDGQQDGVAITVMSVIVLIFIIIIITMTATVAPAVSVGIVQEIVATVPGPI
jgi:hypothetical protein